MGSEDMEDISADIKEFIRTHIASVDTLRVLLLLQSDPQREWTSNNVYVKLYLEPKIAEGLLDGLAKSGVLAVNKVGNPAYRYAPKAAELAGAVDRVVQLDKERPVTLINLIYAASKGSVQAFADAFRLSKG